ncbi:PTS sugar transporter subunit IIA [Bifidobacterium sp. ESL0682]|uniref:PTS sugar transporter subunit IIA n=1 Tax=Bifidobacterium sp. ESL0682 TaxID=2983212 RepID=UPI0023F868DE|nr:PTS sugar transporter subunit IIA [Bifidobacterium sp. ESL0682]WEV42139.1 PTS sugar transporter subunit IIA [Bifidobacterium sp. ESL0682]
MRLIVEWEPTNAAMIIDKFSLFAWFKEFAWRHGLISERSTVTAMLKNRECAGDTSLSETLANPHIQSSTVIEPALVFLKLPVPCSGWGTTPISRVLFTLLPEDVTTAQVAPLENFYRQIAEEDVMRKLCSDELREVESVFEALDVGNIQTINN